MNFPILTSTLAALCLTLPTLAQEGHAPAAKPKEASAQKLTGASGGSQRAETRMMVFNDDFSVFAMASLTHGQPMWKPEYDGMLDKVKGRMNRLGKDWFTTLITSSELEIGGSKIAPGSYVVGLHCDKDGKFALALMDSSKAMKAGLTPFTPEWKPEITAPLTLNKDAAAEIVEEMTMTFAATDGGAGKGTFTLAWGKHTLTAPVMLHAPK